LKASHSQQRRGTKSQLLIAKKRIELEPIAAKRLRSHKLSQAKPMLREQKDQAQLWHKSRRDDDAEAQYAES